MAEGLEQSRLIGGLPASKLTALSRRCAWRHFEPGEMILSLDDADDAVHFVTRGAVRAIVFAASGKQVLFSDVPTGGHFGEIAAIDGAPRSASVIATTRATVAAMPAPVFREMLAAHPEVALAVMRSLTGMIRRLSERVVEFSTLPMQKRLYAELLRLATGRVRDNRAILTPPPLHADIAARIATHREAVTKELSRLARAGLLERRRGALELRDVMRLAEQLCAAEPAAPVHYQLTQAQLVAKLK